MAITRWLCSVETVVVMVAALPMVGDEARAEAEAEAAMATKRGWGVGDFTGPPLLAWRALCTTHGTRMRTRTPTGRPTHRPITRPELLPALPPPLP